MDRELNLDELLRQRLSRRDLFRNAGVAGISLSALLDLASQKMGEEPFACGVQVVQVDRSIAHVRVPCSVCSAADRGLGKRQSLDSGRYRSETFRVHYSYRNLTGWGARWAPQIVHNRPSSSAFRQAR